MQKGDLVEIRGYSGEQERDFMLLREQARIQRKLGLTAKRESRDTLRVLLDGDAFRHNFKEHEKARRAMSLRLLLMQSIDAACLTDQERSQYEAFLRLQLTDVRALISVRTQAAMDKKRARGERLGNVPYGYRVKEDGLTLEPDEPEQGVIAKVASLRESGGTIRSIATELRRLGFKTRRGTAWRHEYVWNLLRTARQAPVLNLRASTGAD